MGPALQTAAGRSSGTPRTAAGSHHGECSSVILRMKEDYDGAEPSPSSVSVLNLLMMAHLTNETDLFERIDRTLKMFGPQIGKMARAVPMMLAALSTYHAKVAQVVIVGAPGDEATRALLREAVAKYDPFSVLVPVDPGATQSRLAEMPPFIGAPGHARRASAAYVCHAIFRAPNRDRSAGLLNGCLLNPADE